MPKTCGSMKINDAENGVSYLSFPKFDEMNFICNAFSTRMGGVSTGIFESMNLGYGRGDSDENVTKNYIRLCTAAGIDPASLVFSAQDHHTVIRRVREQDIGKGIWQAKDYDSVDGLISDLPGTTLVTHYADCVPLYFVDAAHRSIGLSHAGWRGTVDDIAGKTIKKMTECFGSDPAKIEVAIGPSIGHCCYEVDDPVMNFVRSIGVENEDVTTQTCNGKYMLNLWALNTKLLLHAGVLPEHITVASICTCCNNDYLISHRATGGQRGSLAAFLGIRAQ